MLYADGKSDAAPDDLPVAEQLRETIDLGMVDVGHVLDLELRVLNRGGRPLRLTEARTSCECLKAEVLDSEIAGGEAGRIRVHLDVGKHLGPHSYAVMVQTNSAETPVLAWKLRYHVVNGIGISPPELIIELKDHHSLSVPVRIKNVRAGVRYRWVRLETTGALEIQMVGPTGYLSTGDVWDGVVHVSIRKGVGGSAWGLARFIMQDMRGQETAVVVPYNAKHIAAISASIPGIYLDSARCGDGSEVNFAVTCRDNAAGDIDLDDPQLIGLPELELEQHNVSPRQEGGVKMTIRFRFMTTETPGITRGELVLRDKMSDSQLCIPVFARNPTSKLRADTKVAHGKKRPNTLSVVPYEDGFKLSCEDCPTDTGYLTLTKSADGSKAIELAIKVETQSFRDMSKTILPLDGAQDVFLRVSPLFTTGNGSELLRTNSPSPGVLYNMHWQSNKSGEGILELDVDGDGKIETQLQLGINPEGKMCVKMCVTVK